MVRFIFNNVQWWLQCVMPDPSKSRPLHDDLDELNDQPLFMISHADTNTCTPLPHQTTHWLLELSLRSARLSMTSKFLSLRQHHQFRTPQCRTMFKLFITQAHVLNVMYRSSFLNSIGGCSCHVICVALPSEQENTDTPSWNFRKNKPSITTLNNSSSNLRASWTRNVVLNHNLYCWQLIITVATWATSRTSFGSDVSWQSVQARKQVKI